MHYYLMIFATTVALVSGEKLGDIEVITRGELGDGGLVPPDQGDFVQTNEELIQTKNNFVNEPDQKTESKFIPPPALSYLPPVKTPLPIEPTASPYTPAPVIIIQEEYLPPRGVPDEVKPVVEPPNTLYSAPNPAAAADVIVQPVVSPQFSTQAHSQGPVFPASPRPAPIPPLVPQDDNYYLQEDEVEKPGFFSSIQDSKLSVLNGIVGAKSAVLGGLRNAGDSLYSGVTGALAAKAAAFSSLKNTVTGGSSNNNQAQSTYENDGGYGSNPSVGITGTNVGYTYPARPIPPPSSQQTPSPLYVPFPVTTYPAYPPYPPKVPQYSAPQVYPAPIPVYQYRPLPDPLAHFKAKIDGIMQAKRDAVEGVIAKVDAFKDGIKQKISSVFRKEPTPTYVLRPVTEYTVLQPSNPTYSSYNTYDQKETSHMTYPIYQTRPNYNFYPTYYTTKEASPGFIEQVRAQKSSLSSTISRVTPSNSLRLPSNRASGMPIVTGKEEEEEEEEEDEEEEGGGGGGGG
ncbi:uncharacterized protein [Palaemon carinicauda]|uniref:uncharacterized protein n=1 Tax=Palaemon carinicauda TaxID=392227 RepID=UPI0035B594C0